MLPGDLLPAIAESRDDLVLVPGEDSVLTEVDHPVGGEVEVDRSPLDRDLAPEIVDPQVRVVVAVGRRVLVEHRAAFTPLGMVASGSWALD